MATTNRLHGSTASHGNLVTAVDFLYRVAEILDDSRARDLVPDSAHDVRMTLQTTTAPDIVKRALRRLKAYMSTYIITYQTTFKILICNDGSYFQNMIRKLNTGKDHCVLHLILFWKDLGVDNILISSYTLHLWEQQLSFRLVVVKAHLETSLYQLAFATRRQVRLAPSYLKSAYSYQHSSLRETYPDNRRNASRMLLRIREFLQFLNRYRVRELVDEEHQVEADSSVDDNFRECEMDILMAQKVVATKPRIGALPFVKVSGWSGKFNFLGGRYHVWLSWLDDLDGWVSRGTEYPEESFFRQTCFGLFFLVDSILIRSYTLRLWEERHSFRLQIVKAHLDTALLQHDFRSRDPRPMITAANYWQYEISYEPFNINGTDPDNRRNAARIVYRIDDFITYLNRYRIRTVYLQDAEGDDGLQSLREYEVDIDWNGFPVYSEICVEVFQLICAVPRIDAITFIQEEDSPMEYHFLGGNNCYWFRWMRQIDCGISRRVGDLNGSFFHQMYFELFCLVDRGLLTSYARGLWAENRPRLKKRLVKAHLDTALLQHDLREDNPHQRFIAVDYWDYEWAYERSYATDTFPDNRRNASRILLRMAEFLIFLNQYRVIDPTKEHADDDEELESGEERDYSIHNMFHGLLQDCQSAREEVVTMPMIGAVPFVNVLNRKSRWYFLGGDYPVWYRWMDVMDRWLSNAAGNEQESFFHRTYFEIESMKDCVLLQSYKTKLLEATVP